MKYTCTALFFITFLFSQINYESQIQPIFNNNCIFCHQNGGSATLNLATYSGVMSGGWSGPAIIVGDYQNSLLYQRIIQPTGTDGSMPPNDPLSQAQIDLIAQWIGEGAGNSLSTDDVFLPKEHTLHQNYPNPFNPSTVISFSLNKEEFVSIDIYDINGTHMISLFKGKKNIGTHYLNWNGRDKSGALITTGQYFYQLRTSSSSTVMKMLFIK
ncbi:MAG: c-type cytochrome domain-containing protein [bacterium]